MAKRTAKSVADRPAELRVDLAIGDPDGFYAGLLDCYRDLDGDRAALFNARLILLLANQIGDRTILDQAVRRARDGV